MFFMMFRAYGTGCVLFLNTILHIWRISNKLVFSQCFAASFFALFLVLSLSLYLSFFLSLSLSLSPSPHSSSHTRNTLYNSELQNNSIQRYRDVYRSRTGNDIVDGICLLSIRGWSLI